MKKITLPIGVLGQNVELSVAWMDLSRDEFIVNAPRVEIAGHSVPALGGIPLFAKLGQGGMGAVYYGVHRGFAKEVAVKVLQFHLAQTSPELIARFFREARIASKIYSDHLVHVSDVGQEGNLTYLVMEFVAGRTASEILEIGQKGGATGLDEMMTLDICIAACKGLAAAHDAGVVHRDVKPENILVPRAKNGRSYDLAGAKLNDLGLARCEGLHSTVTNAELCFGTPGYMSPEQIDDTRHAGKTADVFSMGATIYTLLSGEAPFVGNSVLATLSATQNTPQIPLTTRRCDVSKPTLDIVEMCLAKDPAHRYADGTALMKALSASRDALLMGDVWAAKAESFTMEWHDEHYPTVPVIAHPIVKPAADTAITQTALKIQANRAPKVPARPGREERRRTAWVGGAIGIVALGAIAIFVYAFLYKFSPAQPSTSNGDIDPAALDATEKNSDARAAEHGRADKSASESYAQKEEALKSAGIEAARKRKKQDEAARVEFESWLAQSQSAIGHGDVTRAKEFFDKARGSSGVAFSARQGELAALQAAIETRAKGSELDAKYRECVASIQRLIADEPLDDFGHFNNLDTARRTQIENMLREAENIHPDMTGELKPHREKLSLGAALDLGGGGTIELVLVPPGEFTMGSKVWVPESGADIEHAVRLSQGYYLSKDPISISQFRRFAEAEAYKTDAETEQTSAGKGALSIDGRVFKYVATATWRHPGFSQQEPHPVVAVSWNDAVAFTAWLSRKTHRVVRLPTEAEWEYAARGPQNRQWPWGNLWIGAKCNHADVALKVAAILSEGYAFSDETDGFVYTSPSGQFDNASWCGARDMAGNVWQWCQDFYGKKYYALSPASDPHGPHIGDPMEFPFGGVSLPGRTLRGGSFLDSKDMCRATARMGAPAIHRAINIGFRILVVPPTKKVK